MPREPVKQKVLVIDDEQTSRIIMESVLEDCGASVLLAATPDEAIELLACNDVALIYMDIMMPQRSGYELAQEIHARQDSRYVPIIFFTARHKDQQDILRSYDSGVVDILHKPVEPEIVKSKTRVFLQLDSQRKLIEEQQHELREAFEKLQRYARHDQLTGLFNRDQITNILARMISRGQRFYNSIAVMFLDLDHFKIINDSYGHDIGDLLLQSTAARIKECVRDEDFVARLGGDEFCVILKGFDNNFSAGIVADRILESLKEPHLIDKHEIISSTSIGIAIYDGSQATAAELLKNADAAMYLAKKKGRSQYAYFSKELEEEAIMRVELGAKLKNAIENDQLQVYYQPKFSANSNTVVGLEALMRWRLDDTFISPVLFISIAEESGLIKELGEWILRAACKQLAQWQQDGVVGKDVSMSVNVSIRQLQHDNFLKRIESVLVETGLAPECLELELTESILMSDPERCIELFRSFHDLGLQLSVDDFGIGYSSLSYLSTLPLDTLKVDRSFVNNIIEDKTNQTIVKAIISLSHNLGLNVVAEGVETQEQLQFLKDNKCDAIQGYLLSKPLPANELIDLL